MSYPVEITVLSDNSVARRDLLAEHGLSFWIEVGAHRVLFDTGQGRVLPHNAECLGLDVGRLDAVAISHGHYDHTGGLPYVLDTLPRSSGLHLHPQALAPRFVRGTDGGVRAIGMTRTVRDALETWPGRSTMSKDAQVVVPGVRTAGVVPRRGALEDVGGAFFLDEACTKPDPIVDDTALVLDTPVGVVVLLGCAHAGVINTLDHVAEELEGRRVHAVLGGMHLGRATAERLEATADKLEALDVEVVAPMHCTGATASAWLHQRLGSRFAVAGAGSRFRFAR